MESRALGPGLAEQLGPSKHQAAPAEQPRPASASRRRRSRRGRSLRPPCRRWAGHPYGWRRCDSRRPSSRAAQQEPQRRSSRTDAAYATSRICTARRAPCLRRDAGTVDDCGLAHACTRTSLSDLERRPEPAPVCRPPARPASERIRSLRRCALTESRIPKSSVSQRAVRMANLASPFRGSSVARRSRRGTRSRRADRFAARGLRSGPPRRTAGKRSLVDGEPGCER